MKSMSLQRFLRNTKGASAVEFALILPFLLILYLGGIEISQAVAVSRKATLVSRTISDLVAQNSTETITTAELNSIFAAANAVMAPYPTDPVKITVSSVGIDASGSAKVEWSRQKNSTQRAKNQPITLPTPAMAVANSTLIMAEVKYLYTPTFGSAFIDPINLSETIYMRPRMVPKINEPT